MLKKIRMTNINEKQFLSLNTYSDSSINVSQKIILDLTVGERVGLNLSKL